MQVNKNVSFPAGLSVANTHQPKALTSEDQRAIGAVYFRGTTQKPRRVKTQRKSSTLWAKSVTELGRLPRRLWGSSPRRLYPWASCQTWTAAVKCPVLQVGEILNCSSLEIPTKQFFKGNNLSWLKGWGLLSMQLVYKLNTNFSFKMIPTLCLQRKLSG